MLLTIDVGNTNLTLGLYPGQEIGSHWRLATDHQRMPDEYGLQFLGLLEHASITPSELSGICLASVVPPLTPRWMQASILAFASSTKTRAPWVLTGWPMQSRSSINTAARPASSTLAQPPLST